MTTVTNKGELLAEVKAAHGRMEALLTRLSPAEITAQALDEGWSVKDSLAHLTAWEKMMLGWIDSMRRGEPVVRYAPGFIETAESGDEPMVRLNEKLYQDDRQRSLDDVLGDFRRTHEEVLGSLDAMSEADIFEPRDFASRKQIRLIDGVIDGNTYGHYDEHLGWITEGLAKHAKSAEVLPHAAGPIS